MLCCRKLCLQLIYGLLLSCQVSILNLNLLRKTANLTLKPHFLIVFLSQAFSLILHLLVNLVIRCLLLADLPPQFGNKRIQLVDLAVFVLKLPLHGAIIFGLLFAGIFFENDF